MDDLKSLLGNFCPYVGLQPYTEADRDYFFGRERDSRIISSNLYAAPLTVLYGASGVGKSSVLRAGVLPRLRASPRTAVVLFDGWSDRALLNTLKARCLEAIAVAGGKDFQVDTNLPLDEFLLLATRAFGSTLLIILDQFEEYFLYHPETETDNTFDVEFAQAVNREEVDANFLISMREDALSKLDRFRTRIPNMLGNALRLQHLDAASAKEAIRNPIKVYNEHHPNESSISVEDTLVERLIEEVRTGKLLIGQGGHGAIEKTDTATNEEIRIETPFLQLVLTRLWEEETQHGSHVLQLATLNALGGAGRIVRTHMDAAMNTLSFEEQEAAASVFRFLVTPSGTKIAYSITDLEYYAGPVRGLESVLQKLAQGDVRIVRPITSPGEPETLRYEIYHDVLAPAVLDWRSRYERGKELLEERVNMGRQMRTMFWWAALGTLIDLILPILAFIFIILSGSIGSVVTFCFSFFTPLGGLAIIPGLRKIRPPLSSGQILMIVIAWAGAFFLSTIILVILYYYVDSLSLSDELMVGMFALFFTVKTLAAPMAGLLAYWQISKARERQHPVMTGWHSTDSLLLSKK